MKKKLKLSVLLLFCALSLQAQWLFWGNGEYQNFQANPWAGVQLDLALRFEPNDITTYEGKSITKMKFHPGPVVNSANYQLKIWEATSGAAPVLMYTQDVSSVTFGQWNEVELTSPWPIDTSMELWFGVSISHTGAVGYDAGPVEPGKGNKFGNGVEWYDWGSGNWTVQAYAENAAPSFYTLTLLANPEEGGEVAGGGTFQAGEIIPVAATAAQGFEFAYWSNGEVQIFDPVFDFTMPAEDVTLTAVFEPAFQPEWLFWGDGEYQNFQANPWAGVQLDLALRFEPDDIAGYDGKSIVKMKFHPGPIQNAASYQLKIWEADPGVFPVLLYTQTVSSVTFGQWNEIELTTPWTINATKELWFGVSISHTGAVGYDAGPAEPGKGNKFGNGVEWYDWGDGNWTVQALISGGGATSYNLGLQSNPEEGGTVSGSGTYQAGQNIDIEAVANPDFEFVNWTKDGEVISTEAAFTFIMPEENLTLTANFESTIPLFILSLSANPENGGTLSGAGEYAAGVEMTVSALENEGFSFVNWTQDGTVVSTEESFAFVMPAENTQLVANFNMIYPDSYQVTIGGGQQFPQEVRMPFDFDWRNSVSQTLYYPEELGISKGVIDQLTYYKNFSQDVMNKTVKVWMGETTRQNLVSGWIPPSELTLVFDGLVDFPQGQGEINIQLDSPFQYNGGVLVIYSNRAFEQQYYSWNERFFATQDTGKYRTRQFNEDVPIDPMDPSLSSNYILDWHPNITLGFPTDVLGGIEGIVSDGSQPLEGVKVSIEGTTAEVFTNSSGYYSIPFIQADTYEIRFSRLGFMTHIEPDYVIEAGGISTLDGVLDASALVEVSGILRGNDGMMIQDAEILLSGNSDYMASSGPEGLFMINEVYEGLYTLFVTADNYVDYVAEDILITQGNADLGTIILAEKITPPLGLTVNTESQEAGKALLNWYHGEGQEFRYDNGTYTYWVGSADGDINSVFGSAYRSDAVLTEVSWYLTSEVGIVYPEVKIWIFGLGRNGIPDTSNLIYTMENVPNINDEWNVHVLDMPVVASDGFFVGVSYPGFYALGCDDGLDPEWPFTENTLYYVEYGETDFIPIESLVPGWDLNFMIRAYGVNNQELKSFADAESPVPMIGQITILSEQAALANSPVSPFVSTDGNNGYREFIGFNVFLNNMDNPLTTINGNQYLLEYLPAGEYLAGVQSVYTSGVSEIITENFEITMGAPPQSILIPEGWSGWSAYNIPGGDGAFADVVDPVAGQMVLTQYFNQVFYPQYGVNTMGDFSNTHGYVSKMNSDVELLITGLRTETTLELSEGWNLMPVPTHCSADAATLFGQIPELIIAVEVAGNGIYWPGITNTLEVLVPGRAYWVKVSDNCSLAFPACSPTDNTSTKAPLRFSGATTWNPVACTDLSHIVVFDQKVLRKLESGDIIGAFTNEGICAGITVYENNGVSFVLYGDDMTTVEKDGFAENESINLRLYRNSLQQEYDIEVVFSSKAPDSQGTYTSFGVSLISDIELLPTGIDDPGDDLIEVYPNPSEGIFSVRNISAPKNVGFSIRNVTGITVKSGFLRPDKIINLQEQPDGIYFLYLQDHCSKPKKLIKK
ncbi:MAG: carboxypeptidase regulatory-like domain-containing protein [Bacteroidales bacterium]|nr:carboxypeptidase regulatory-like domain-containing protein [Bacteroidales bacterium]